MCAEKWRRSRNAKRRAPAYLERVKECLKPIVEHAAAKNIRLGIEGRRGYEEIPSERELPALLDELNSPQVGYWHDMGHIQIKENLGFVDHEEWLRSDRAAHARLSCAGLHLAGAGSSAALRRRRRSGETGSASAADLLICLGNESAQNGRGNPPLRHPLERTLRRMKKILITLLQIAVTIAVLFWVFHDPHKRAQMAVALADGGLSLDGVRRFFAYFLVEFAAALSLAHPAQGSANSSQHSARLGSVS